MSDYVNSIADKCNPFRTQAFYGTKFKSVQLPTSLKAIGLKAFENSSVTEITFGNQSDIFLDCVDEFGNVIGKILVAYHDYNYRNGDNLRDRIKEIFVKPGVRRIEDMAFGDVGALETAILPDSVTYIGDNAFDQQDCLTSINLPNSLTHIESCAFQYCDSLSSVIIPDKVISIESQTFYHCTSLSSITIPNSVTSIGNYAFYDCTALKSLKIPGSVTSIGAFALGGNRLTELDISDTTITLDWVSVFGSSMYLNKITKLICKADQDVSAFLNAEKVYV